MKKTHFDKRTAEGIILVIGFLSIVLAILTVFLFKGLNEKYQYYDKTEIYGSKDAVCNELPDTYEFTTKPISDDMYQVGDILKLSNHEYKIINVKNTKTITLERIDKKEKK